MTEAETRDSTPPINTSANNVKSQEKALARQEAQRQRALKRLRKLRTKAADEIDRLLDFLDASDIDPDLEPTLGFMNGPPEMDECETPVDDEPSLGFLESHPTNWSDGRDRSGNQDHLCAGLGGDLEDEHDGAEPDVDGRAQHRLRHRAARRGHRQR